jgi:ankyrin repeat protein
MISCVTTEGRLFECIASGDIDCVEQCIKEGADLNTSYSNEGWTPLQMAIETNEGKIARLLIQSGADPRKCMNSGRSTVYDACNVGNVELLNLVIEHGVSLKESRIIGDSMIAAYKGHLKILKYLVSKGVPMNYKVKKRYGSPDTFMMNACEGGHVKVVEWLLQNGATLAVSGISGNTPLLQAVIDGHRDLVRFLLEQGVNPDAANNFGETALLRAARNGYLEIAKMLLENGANPNSYDYWQDTSLMEACKGEGNLDMARLLVSNGASVSRKDKDGKTALNYAEEAGKSKVVEYLKERVLANPQNNSPATRPKTR